MHGEQSRDTGTHGSGGMTVSVHSCRMVRALQGTCRAPSRYDPAAIMWRPLHRLNIDIRKNEVLAPQVMREWSPSDSNMSHKHHATYATKPSTHAAERTAWPIHTHDQLRVGQRRGIGQGEHGQRHQGRRHLPLPSDCQKARRRTLEHHVGLGIRPTPSCSTTERADDE